MQLALIAAALLATTGRHVLAAPANTTLTSVNATMTTTDAPMTTIMNATMTTTDAPMVTLNATMPAENATAIITPSATNSSWAAQVSPIFPNMVVSPDAQPYINNGTIDTNATLSKETLNLTNYPEIWKSPDPKHPEVQAMIARLNWDLVPNIKKHKSKKGDLVFKKYDEDADPDCWWSASGCTEPKLSYLPPDLYTCPTKGDWGLTYDDGPFNLLPDDDSNNKTENPYAEPRLYNFLAKEDLKATLFYIGSNVATYPAAARRALSDGHTLCVHTWSHPTMTTQSNEKVVAELYWTLKAIKEATGVTVKCWRPPQGDVDDRVRAIAHQMGLRTVLWNRDTNDWDMPAPGGGKLSPATVDGYFRTWIKEEEQGKNKEGVLVLEHELNHATVNMTEAWLPTVKKTFNVVSAMTCNNVLQPYWENVTYQAIH